MMICLIYLMYVVRKTKEQRTIPQFLSWANRKNKGGQRRKGRSEGNLMSVV